MALSLTVKNFEPIRLVGSVPLELDFEEKNNVLIISKHQSYLTHGVHKFPAKFFPELPRYLISKYSKLGDVVLDPMCGSGTTLLESILQNRHAIGVDIDPIAKMISRVKTTPIETSLLDEAREKISIIIDKKIKSNKKPNIPEFNYRDKWFKPFVLEELGIIKETILELSSSLHKKGDFSDNSISNLTNFLLIIFSSIIRDVSNADPHCTRTVIRKNIVKKTARFDTINKFFFNLDKQILGMKEFVSIHNRLYYKFVNIDKDSDPRTHQLELYWLGLVNGDPLAKMKRDYIGTEAVFTYEYNKIPETEYTKLNWLIKNVNGKDQRRAYILYRFFKDMEKNLQEVFRVLKPSARYCVVIGNNTVRDIYVKSHEIITQMALSQNIGFELETYFHSGLINHYIKIPRKERMPGEWVLVFRKPNF